MPRLRVLILSRNYPSEIMPQMGVWVEGLVRHLAELCDVRVVAPVPYCPPLPGGGGFARYRQIPSRHRSNGVEIWRPRFVTGPGYSLHNFEASTYYAGVRRRVGRLHKESPFDVIHAHFTYPDGVVAARLGRRLRVPVLITEHSPWLPWMEQYPRVRRQAVWAFEESTIHMPVSRYVRDTIERFTGESEKFRVVSVGVDDDVFTLDQGRTYDTNQIAFVGRIHTVKGVDILFRAMHQLIDRRRNVRLVMVGGGFLFRDYQLQEQRLRALAKELGLDPYVSFVGLKSPPEVARILRESALLVLPSRAESFGAVLVEALACGTPFVSTHCGGPEDIIAEDVGVLVPTEDADSLAKAIHKVLDTRDKYDPVRLRRYAVENFSWKRIARRTLELYHEALVGQRVSPCCVGPVS